MRINSTVQPYQRSGANVPEKASKLTREMFWDAYSKTMLDSNVETMVTPIPQKSMGSVLKEAWLKVFPKKEEKAGNDIIATSWDEMGH